MDAVKAIIQMGGRWRNCPNRLTRTHTERGEREREREREGGRGREQIDSHRLIDR